VKKESEKLDLRTICCDGERDEKKSWEKKKMIRLKKKKHKERKKKHCHKRFFWRFLRKSSVEGKERYLQLNY